MIPKVCVLTTTYNHEQYIAQAVESVVSQETDFPFEMVIGEDCSTDCTRQILLNFQNQYPDILKLKLRPNNLGRRHNFIDVLLSCQGQYISILEGDDYWTSQYKLQKQVDFLDSHPNCTLCFHPVHQVFENRVEKSRLFSPKEKKTYYTIEDIAERHFIATCSLMFRNGLVTEFPPWFHDIPAADWPLSLLLAQYGVIGYIPESMGIYRVHGHGAWTTLSTAEKLQYNLDTRYILRSAFMPRYQNAFTLGITRTQIKLLRVFLNNQQPIKFLRYAFSLISQKQLSYSGLKAVIWNFLIKYMENADS